DDLSLPIVRPHGRLFRRSEWYKVTDESLESIYDTLITATIEIRTIEVSPVLQQ
ncbi:hypothetical protein K0M31_007720, partial [Melipona bicolor]